MKAVQVASAEQVIPISQARARLASLVDEVKKKDFFLIARKYRPQAALVDIKFMDKLLSIYKKWQRREDLEELRRIRRQIPQYPAAEVEKDIQDAIRAIRKNA